MLLKTLIQGYKAGGGWKDSKWYSESHMIKGKASVMEPCYGVISLLRDTMAVGVTVLAVMVDGW